MTWKNNLTLAWYCRHYCRMVSRSLAQSNPLTAGMLICLFFQLAGFSLILALALLIYRVLIG